MKKKLKNLIKETVLTIYAPQILVRGVTMSAYSAQSQRIRKFNTKTTVFLEKMIVTQLVTKLNAFMELPDLLPC